MMAVGMGAGPANINLVFGWLWIALGFLGGFVLGLNFHRDDWLGGYSSFQRRLYRLAHIAVIALGIINLLFFFTIQSYTSNTSYSSNTMIASWGFIIGAITMPLACILMARRPALRALFLIPVVSLVTAAILTFLEVLRG